ncbi:hypothetical protein B0H11DRAFT_1802355 [Mycena galericulata]|nr:hypothetical protein B0H11DRAFT_1802355 [Mycena galericulata]
MAPTKSVRSAIDGELELLYERIASLKVERNTLAPIARLPNELLAYIFGICAKGASTSGAPMHWVKVVFVCQHWNEVAFSSRAIWAYIHFIWHPSERRLLVQLMRSGAVPVSVHVGFLHSHSFFADRMVESSHRISVLDVGGDISDVVDLMRRMSHHEFPLLHSLSLRPRNDELQEDPDIHPVLPSELLDGGMPRLSNLALSYIDAPWRSLSSLRSLSLIGDPSSISTNIPLGDLFVVLKSSPQLHTLKLNIAVHPDRPDEEYETVALPFLEHIFIRELLDVCECLITNLVFRPTTRVELYPQGIAIGADIRDILVPLRKHLRAAGAPIPRMLSICVPRREADHSNFFAAVYPHSPRPTRFDDDVLFAINGHPENARALRQIMTKVLKTLPADVITHLDATGTHFTGRTWKTAFALLPALRVITVHVTDGGMPLVEALLEAGAAVSISVLCLRTFILWGSESGDDVVLPFFDVLTRLLSAWHARGTPLERLEVEDCLYRLKVGDAKWAELRGFVGELVREADLAMT